MKNEPHHRDREHALLSASSAHRWLECPPCARYEDQFEDVDTEYSLEGTRAHEIAQSLLGLHLIRDRKGIEELLATFTDEDRAIVSELVPFIDFVVSEFRSHKLPGSGYLLEQQLDYSPWVPEGFGTGDVILFYDDTIEVIDLKYGKGVRVDAPGNPQLRLYGLGAYNTYQVLYDIKKVKMTIMQPRLDHISSDELSIEDLLDWAENTVKPQALLAWEGLGEFKPGPHLRFGKGMAQWKIRKDYNMSKLEDLAPIKAKNLEVITPEEVTAILDIAPELELWLKQVREYALDQALAGNIIPGYKVVEGRSIRKIAKADQLVQELKDKGYPEEMLYERKLLGLTELTKAVGKKTLDSLSAGVIIKPQGAPTLVPEADNRPAISASPETEFAEVLTDKD